MSNIDEKIIKQQEKIYSIEEKIERLKSKLNFEKEKLTNLEVQRDMEKFSEIKKEFDSDDKMEKFIIAVSNKDIDAISMMLK